ncbi:MAG: hypothetical protein H6735_30755 [Alphaproteobacteria bacterium]|nr:hypothetical protein [Alphaproteobacteria bacterium]
MINDQVLTPVRGAVVGAITLLLGWWGWATGQGWIGNVRVLDRPQGDEVVLSLLTVLEVPDADHYVVGNSSLAVPVQGASTGLHPGQDVTVGGTVRDGYVEAAWHEVAPGRTGKKRLGFVGLALVGLVVAGTLRVTRRGLELRG